VPNVTIRDVTERPETIECGSNILVGVDPALMVEAVGMVTAEGADWEVPAGYLDRNVSLKVMKILRGCLSS